MQDINPIFPDINDGRPIVIAGPCSIETEEQVMTTARGLADIGIKIFRGGVWKPRTSPGCFEGVGEKGLAWLKNVKEETGMIVSTEVANKSHVKAALDAGVDMIWLGARTTANPFAVQEIADEIARSGEDLSVLVKNPVNPDLELWIGALKRIYNSGVRKLGAVHRGFSSYGKHFYRNIPHWRIPIELQRRYPNLPVFCDPSHISGKRELIGPVSQHALDMNFAGLMIESHCKPEEALSDSNQQVTPLELKKILQNLELREGKATTESLIMLRRQVDDINEELLELLSRRMSITQEIGRLKKENNLPVVQKERYNELMDNLVNNGKKMGLSEEFLRNLLTAIHEESVRRQLEI